MADEKCTKRTLEDWQKKWVEGDTGFHFAVVNPILKIFMDKLTAGKEKCSVFVPLCGKSLDMKWLYDQGHTVVGVEISEIAITQFFKECDMEYSSDPIGNASGTLYKSIDGRIKLYCCDLFDFNRDTEGTFDCIWDRASLIAISEDDRQRYSQLMVSLMVHQTNYLLATYEFDSIRHPGPPFVMTEKDIQSLYGNSCAVGRLAVPADIPEYEGGKKVFGEDFCVKAYLLSLNVTVEAWTDFWKKDKIGFHMQDVNILLEKHIQKLLNNRKSITIFVPLCGKSVDMKWLADMGHFIVGVEASEQGIEQFFEEQSIEYVKTPLEIIPGSLYKSVGGQIKLYCCDFFDIQRELNTKFDAIWDRASLVAVNTSDRKQYADVLKELMACDCCTLLETLVYNQTEHQGTPRLLSEEDILLLFGDKCMVETIETVDSSIWPFYEETRKRFGMSKLELRLSLITVKP